jgi:flagellar biosynthesis/type III secretory pathway chaperone
MEGNISHLRGSGGTVLAGDMLGKVVRSIFEQKSTLANVTNTTDSIRETIDTKVNVTVSEDEETEVKQNVYPK